MAQKADTPVVTDRDFLITRTIHASCEQVFNAWMQPGRLKRWFGPNGFTNPYCKVDPRVGGVYRIIMRSEEGTEYPVKGVYREIKAPERLVMTVDCSEHPEEWKDLVKPNRSNGERDPVGTIVQTVRFEDLAGRTKLTILACFKSKEIRDAMLRIGMNGGWSQSLDRLSTLLVRREERPESHVWAR
jgi:uncharacterized protein YndB with AHSA1/START domain